MRWLNAAAWGGLVAAAIPVLVHLLNRHRARVQPFPTLRFLDAVPVMPVRRTRLTDIPLMVLRMVIVAVAVAALAQPVFVGRARVVRNAGVVRAIIVDTSASMLRRAAAATTATSARVAAFDSATRIASSAAAQITLATASPDAAIPGAAAWLSAQMNAGAGELVIVSDFQRGALHRADLASIPAHAGIRLVRVDVVPDSGPINVEARMHGRQQRVRVVQAGDGADLEWTSAPAPPRPDAHDSVVVLAGAAERAAANAAQDAADAATAQPVELRAATGADRRIVVVFPQFTARDSMLRASMPLDVPWMVDVVSRLRADSLLTGAARTATVTAISASDARTIAATRIAVAQSDEGDAVIRAARGRANGRDALLLFAFTAPGTTTSAAVFAAANRARNGAVRIEELDHVHVSDAELRTWERPAGAGTAVSTTNDHDASDGRWLWLAVLALLAVEVWMRRETIDRHAHVA